MPRRCIRLRKRGHSCPKSSPQTPKRIQLVKNFTDELSLEPGHSTGKNSASLMPRKGRFDSIRANSRDRLTSEEREVKKAEEEVADFMD